MARESTEQALLRWDHLCMLQMHYSTFKRFLHDVQKDVFGWETTDIQYDIGDYLIYGGDNIMLQAQRGQAKTTISAVAAVYLLIHDPKHRVLIFSAGAKKASEISKGIYNIIHTMPELECLRPDRSNGDRVSVESFDIHYTLRGASMNPSVACLGITSNMQGYRADTLFADDIETAKNASTQIQRDQLLHRTLDFTSICAEGRTIYLGTPQTVDSIYNSLPGRGYKVRIWTGRYPTDEEISNYGKHLAPIIRDRLLKDPSLQTGGGLLGDSGKAVDIRLNETVLQQKELDQGKAYFKLQHMLDTKLTDEERFPLKPENLICMHLNDTEVPSRLVWQPKPELEVPVPYGGAKVQLYRPASTDTEFYKYTGKHAYIDTAGGGQNGDETVIAVTYYLNGYVFLMDIQSFRGGHREDVMLDIAKVLFKWDVQMCEVEKNFGYGAFAASMRPIVDEYYASHGREPAGVQIEDVWESGQKELRIIDTLEPIMARHKLVLNESIVKSDISSSQKYPLEKRMVYQFLHQLSRITRSRGSLIHDDRIDAVTGSVRHWVQEIAVQEEVLLKRELSKDRIDFFNEWSTQKSGKKPLASYKF